jgi:hypothetical protein
MARRLYKRSQVDLDLDSIWDFIADDIPPRPIGFGKYVLDVSDFGGI